ncbi:pilus assembly protein [Desulfurivibrio sp. C05AmB]|uniref:pilus assembly protein n=1 Tax=Desulfurivibrio sp. C05AmB TaxID=3374371 RepID=UPI00376EE9D7
MKAYREIRQAALIILLALICLSSPIASWAVDRCVSNNPDEIPPFLATSTVDPNLLLIIDNSASMYDLAYVDDAGYCYDDKYNRDENGNHVNQTYVGYFDPDGWYLYDFISDNFVAADMDSGCSDANYRKGLTGNRQVCLKTISSLDDDGDTVIQVSSFAARGNYLNWATASKMDIEKSILTGGKYDGNALVMESRGCLEKRFVKETTIDLAGQEGNEARQLTLAIRQPSDAERANNPNDYTTRIEIFPATISGFQHEACQNAVEEMRPPAGEDEEAKKQRLGRLKGYIDVCMGFDSLKPNDPEVSSQSAFNQAIQTCWFIVKHNDPSSITTGDINRIKNSCEGIYEGNAPPGVDPNDISTDHSGYVCFGNYDAKRLGHGGIHPNSVSGYVGYCWDHGAVTWRPNDKINQDGWKANSYADVDSCVRDGLFRYCGIIDVPPVTDPSDQVTGVGDETGEFWNLPAVLVDSGVVGQLGSPLAVLKGRVASSSSPSGLLQEFAGELRIGAMIFNYDGAQHECSLPGAHENYACGNGVRDGGQVIHPVGGDTQGLINEVNDIVANTWTPLAESMYNAVGYYKKNPNLRLHLDDFKTDEDPIIAWCQMNNILLITDGASTADQNPTMMNFANALDYKLGSDTCDALHGSTYLDDLAKFAHEDIWRDRIFPQGEARQTVTTHVVAVGNFRDEGADKCSPDVLLAAAAESGGTTLYQAENLNQLEPRLREAFRNILAGAAAGSAASVISATRSGEGAVYQAIFWPEKFDQAGNMITWAGEVQALFVDARGRLYEDSNRNRRLDAEDQPVGIFHDPIIGSSRACIGTLTDEVCDGEVKDIAEVNYLWSANGWLSNLNDGAVLSNRAAANYMTDASRRYIFTWNDRSGDGLVNSNEVIPFEAATIYGLGPEVYRDLKVESAEEAQNVVNWVRGLDQAGLRSRRIETSPGQAITWRLGDVVHSTPTVVSRPAEGYHFLYRSPSYAAFANRYNHRRHMIYFGGNDGMLHAVNGGFFNAGQKKFCLTPSCADEAGAMPLGTEMWAYVPYNLWPHLRCLSDPEYGHKYYVDLVPRVFDVQIFDPADPNHPGGWGTILVGGMRFGGEKTTANDKTFNSAFFILDITNPEEPPKLLAEMTFPGDEAEMGFTTAVPTMVPMVEDGVSEWYLVLGSGPTNLKGESSQTGRVAVISLRQLIAGEIPFRLPTTAPAESTRAGSFALSGHPNSFVSDLITVDFDLNFLADSVYFGTVSGNFSDGWGGMVYRLVTEKLDLTGRQTASHPHQWSDLLPGKTNPLPLIDVGQPVTAAPAAAWDGSNYWIYFGTGRLFNREDYNDQNVYTYYGIKEPQDCLVNRFTWDTVERKNVSTASLSADPGQRGLLQVDQIEVRSNINAAGALLECRDGTANCLPPDTYNFQQLRQYIVGFGCQSDQRGTDGWYRKFHDTGERNLGQATVLGGLLTYSAYLPSDDVCRPEGFSDLYALFYQTGTAWHRPVFSRFQEPGGEFVQYQQRIGPGLAITPSLHVGTETGAKAFLQTSTGAIVGIEQPELPFREFRTGRESWREIYRQIFTD